MRLIQFAKKVFGVRLTPQQQILVKVDSKRAESSRKYDEQLARQVPIDRTTRYIRKCLTDDVCPNCGADTEEDRHRVGSMGYDSVWFNCKGKCGFEAFLKDEYSWTGLTIKGELESHGTIPKQDSK